MGILALDERLPRSLSMRALRLLSWVAIALGVSALAGGKGRCFTDIPAFDALQLRLLSHHRVAVVLLELTGATVPTPKKPNSWFARFPCCHMLMA